MYLFYWFSAMCVSTIEQGLCYVWGDPHYVTFDAKLIHYQGVCKYLLSGTKDGVTLPQYKVIGYSLK